MPSTIKEPWVISNVVWREDSTSVEHLTNQNSTVEKVIQNLPKYFSCLHKQKVQRLTEQVRFDKILPAHFWFIYPEITGFDNRLKNNKQAEYDERIKVIIKNSDKSLKGLESKNAKKTKFNKFWDIAKNILDEITTVDTWRCCEGSQNSGEVVVNMSIAISARDLYEKITKEALKQNLTESEIPSLSWFKFHLWPKDFTTHSALNYTGCFSVKYIMQQRIVKKSHDDNHYANAIYKYARQYAIDIRDLTSFICTDDKHEILLGEPGFLLSALPCGRRVLVGKKLSLWSRGSRFFNIIINTNCNIVKHYCSNSWWVMLSR